MPLSTSQIPEGFSPLPARAPFSEINGPVYRRGLETYEYGFLCEQRHANSLGFMHGGMIAALMDGGSAQALADRYNCRMVTTRLEVDYLRAIPINRWLDIGIEITPETDNRMFVATQLFAGNRTYATAKLNFKLFP